MTGADDDATELRPDDLPSPFPGAGDRLGNWELVRPLQSGGMGVVYLGRRADDSYDQQVAIKLVRPVHLQAEGELRRRLIARFEEERAILARMSHPNVARILDGGSTAAGFPWLVMEFVDGVSLTDWCRERRLDIPARLAIFRKVCDGVQEAHRHLVVHRDLKPDNILVGDNGEPRLLDFGIAKLLEAGTGPGARDDTSLSALTPAYASPEQVRQQALTTSSDVYSLGVVLYQLLAGVRPYELGGLRPSEAEHVVCDVNPEPMRRMLGRAAIPEAERRMRRAQITLDVERIVAKAMHKEVDRRYGSAQELADDIGRYLAGEPVHAAPDSAAYRAGKFLRRHRVGAIAATLAIAAIVGAAGIAFWQAAQARRAAADLAQVNGFLMDVLAASDPFNAGSEITLSRAVDDAAAKVGARFAGRPDLSAGVRQALGYSMLSRYRLDAADALLVQAHDDARAAFGADAMTTLKVRESIAQLRLEQGRVDDAVAEWEAVIAAMEAQSFTREPLYAIALGNLGQLHLRQEDYAEADRWLRRAQAAPAPSRPAAHAAADRANLLANLAQAAHGLGDTARADALYRQAQAGLEAIHPDGSPEIAVLLNNRAQLTQEGGDQAGAFALWQQSAQMRERAFAGDHPMLVTALTDLARQALRLEKYDYGAAQAAKAAAMADRLYAQPAPAQVMAHAVDAAAKMMTKDFAASGVALTRAAALLAAMPPDDYLQGTVDYVRGELCKRPRTPAVPACAGIEPSEPARP